MALPTNANTGYVKGSFIDSTGALASGTITFTASPKKILDPDSTPPVTILPLPVPVNLSTGAFIQQLIATDDPDLEPLGFTYRVDFNLTAAGKPFPLDSFNVLVPTGLSTAAVDLADPGIVVDPNTGQVIDINTDVLATAETYTDDSLAQHVSDPNPHTQYARFTNVAGAVLPGFRVVRAYEADQQPPVVQGAILIKGGF